MFQTFTAATTPETGPARLANLRAEMVRAGVDGFLVPRADAHQGEYVVDADKRLQWLTGFTGSAGFCCALSAVAGVFVDGRYRTQVRGQVDLDAFTPVNWPETKLHDWLRDQMPDGGVVGFDPWLHTAGEIEAATEGLQGSGITLQPTENLVDRIWTDRPARPLDPMQPYPASLAGRDSADKRDAIAATLRADGQAALAITQPDAIAWLLNTRGSDLGQTPVALAFAILRDDASVSLFIDPAKVDDQLRTHLGNSVDLSPPDAFGPALSALSGAVRVDRSTAPVWVGDRLREGGAEVAFAPDPVAMAKAQKNETEIAGTRAAHIRDGAAMAEFLCWFDQVEDYTALTEVDLVEKLEACRRATGVLENISFDTICGSGPNGAIMHYRVTEESNRRLCADELIVLDSGGQYRDGTTDITRTLATGDPGPAARRAFTLVLKGMIAISRVRFPHGVAGRDLDALARYPLWLDGQDYDHGTGHGVGVFLGVHEGPHRLSRASSLPLVAGMMLSNEPGYYRVGHWGIRIENLIVTRDGTRPDGGDPDRDWLDFETLTFAPIDRNLIDADLLDGGERAWLDAYHGEVLQKVGPLVGPDTRHWLAEACAPM